MFDNWRNDQWQGIFSPDEDDLTQEYFVYFKEKQRGMTGKDPPRRCLTLMNTGSQVVSRKLAPQERQVTVILPFPFGTRSCWPQLGHLK